MPLFFGFLSESVLLNGADKQRVEAAFKLRVKANLPAVPYLIGACLDQVGIVQNHGLFGLDKIGTDEAKKFLQLSEDQRRELAKRRLEAIRYG